MPRSTKEIAPANHYCHRTNYRVQTLKAAVKHSLGYAVRACDWYREFRAITLMCIVYNIKRSLKQ